MKQKRHVAAPVPSTPPLPIRENPKGIFGEGLSLHQYLDRMLDEFGNTTLSHTDKLPGFKEFRIDVFKDALDEAYRLLSPKSKLIYDSIYHALAFAVAMEFDDYHGCEIQRGDTRVFVSGLEMMREKIEEFIRERQKSYNRWKAESTNGSKARKPVELYTLILQDLKPKFEREGFGWGFDNNGAPNTSTSAGWERSRLKRGLEPRWEYFPVQRAKDAAPPLPQPELAFHKRLPPDREVRTDVAHTPVEPVTKTWMQYDKETKYQIECINANANVPWQIRYWAYLCAEAIWRRRRTHKTEALFEKTAILWLAIPNRKELIESANVEDIWLFPERYTESLALKRLLTINREK